MCDEYIPDSDDLKDWEELVQEQKQWTNKSFTLHRNGVTKTMNKQKFIEYLRAYIVTKVENYTSLTKRELVEQLDQVFHVKEELRRYCDLSTTDFESMLTGTSFPYLEHAWNSMFHAGLLEDMSTMIVEKRKKRTKRSSVVESKSVKKASTLKYSKREDCSLKSIMTATNRILKLDNVQARLLNNTIRVLLLRQEVTLRYQTSGITLQQFIDICQERDVPVKSIDRVFETGTLFSNIFIGYTKSVSKQAALVELFQDIFHVQLLFK